MSQVTLAGTSRAGRLAASSSLTSCRGNFSKRHLGGSNKPGLARLPSLNSGSPRNGGGGSVADEGSFLPPGRNKHGAGKMGAPSSRKKLALNPDKKGFRLSSTWTGDDVDLSRNNDCSSGDCGDKKSNNVLRPAKDNSSDGSDNEAFMRDLTACNGLQFRLSGREDEVARHQRTVKRRIEQQERMVRRPSLGEFKTLLKTEIMKGIGDGSREPAFSKIHRGRGTIIKLGDIREAVRKLGLGFTEPEIVSIFQSFEADQSGGIDFREVCNWLDGIEKEQEEQQGKTGSVFRPGSESSDIAASKRRVLKAQAKAKAALDRVLKRTMAANEELLREKILGSIGGGAFELLRAFRRMHRGRGTLINLNDFKAAVSLFNLGLDENEVEVFFKGFDVDGSGGIDFKEFCEWVGGVAARGGCGSSLHLGNAGGNDKQGEDTSGDCGARLKKSPAEMAQERVTQAFHKQAGQMTPEELHVIFRNKLLSTVKPGGATLQRTYRSLHRGEGYPAGGISLSDFKEAIHRYGMGITDNQVERLFRRYDSDDSGYIDYRNFLKHIVYSETLKPEDPRQAVARGADGAGAGDADKLLPGLAATGHGRRDVLVRSGAICTENSSETSAREGGEVEGDNESEGGIGGATDGGNYGGVLFRGESVRDKEKPGRWGGEGLAELASEGNLPLSKKCKSTLSCSAAIGARAENKIRDCLHNRWRPMLAAFRRRDESLSGIITRGEFWQVLSENSATRALVDEDMDALAVKHALPGGRVDYQRFMKHLLLSGNDGRYRSRAASVHGIERVSGAPGGKAAGDGSRQGLANRPSSMASVSLDKKKLGLAGSKSTGALGPCSSARQPDFSRRCQNNDKMSSINNDIDFDAYNTGKSKEERGEESNDGRLRARAITLCRKLQPHVSHVWKPLWKDLKDADASVTKRNAIIRRKKQYRGYSYNCNTIGCNAKRGASNGTWCGDSSNAGITTSASRGTSRSTATGEVETHVFSKVLARYGLELSSRDLYTLEHLPSVLIRGCWTMGEPAARAGAATESGQRGRGGAGRIPYGAFLDCCLTTSPVRGT